MGFTQVKKKTTNKRNWKGVSMQVYGTVYSKKNIRLLNPWPKQNVLSQGGVTQDARV